LRPFLARLDPAEHGQLLDHYTALLADAFPPQIDGKVLLHYLRLFFIAIPGGQAFCRCEERSDEAISRRRAEIGVRLLRFARNDD
jgi:hypothetical protein